VTHYKTLPTAGLVLAIAAVMALGWRAGSLDLWGFEILLILIGVGFGPLPALTQVAVQNVVPRHQLGISLGAMNFSRNLLATILVAAFGAIVLAGSAALDQGASAPALTAGWQHGTASAAAAFAWIFYADAACITIALIALVLMAERPLQEEP
jgi:MFS family permease